MLNRSRTRGLPALIWLLLAVLLLAFQPAAQAQSAKKAKDAAGDAKPAKAAKWTPNPAEWEAVTPESVRKELSLLASPEFGSRAVGQAGHAKVRQYVKDELTRIGLKPFEQRFRVTAPVDQGATLTVGDKQLQVYAVWPNIVVPSYAPPEGIIGPIIDGGAGELTDLDGKEIRGAVVLLDFNSGKNWENAAKFGAKAILFRHPVNTTQIEASKKFFLVPLETPRFLLSAQATRQLDAALRDAAGKPLTGTLRGGASWQDVPCANLYAWVPGSDPKAQVLIVQCYMDSMCVAPAAPHGADSALQLVAGLNVARAFAADAAHEIKPKSSVLLVFYDAHHYALAGEREFAYLVTRKVRGATPEFDYLLPETKRGHEGLTLEDAARIAEERTGAIAEAIAFLQHSGSATAGRPAIDVLAERISKLGQACRMTVARELNARQADIGRAEKDIRELSALPNPTPADTARLAEAREQAASYPAHIPVLKGLRDWYSKLDALDVLGQIELVRKGPPLAADSPLGQRYAAALLSVDTIANSLNTILTDARADAETLRSYVEASSQIWAGREVLNSRYPGVGIVLEPAPGADQLTWSATDKFGVKSGAGGSLFPNMLAAQQPVIEAMAQAMKLGQPVPLDDAFSIEASTTKGNKAAPTVSSNSPLFQVGMTSYGLTGMNVSRTLVDTPADLPDSVDMDKAADSLRFLCGFVPYLAGDVTQISQERNISPKVTSLYGRVVRYDIQANVFPDQPVPGALAYLPLNWLVGLADDQRTQVGVRFAAAAKVDQLGRYAFHNIPDKFAKSTKKEIQLYGFRLDAGNHIDFALDNSAQGTEMLTNKAKRTSYNEKVDIVVAPARGLAVYDLIDPRFLTPLTEIRALNAISLAKLETWSYYFPKANDDEAGGPYLENCGLIFAPPKATIAALISAGASGTRAAYLNLVEAPRAKPSDPIKYQREGYWLERQPENGPVERQTQITFTTLRVAEDFIKLNDERLAAVSKFGIRNTLLEGLTADSRDKLKKAQEAYARHEYSEAYRQATHAWGVALRAYPQVSSLGKDAVIGSVFFLALVLPFSFFMERLTIRAKTPNMRVVGTLGWFAAVFTLLYFVHPAYAISSQPMIVLLAFIMIALVAIVFSIIYRKFVALVRQYRNQLEGVHGADLKRFSASGVAVSLSLSTMARRKARTLLTGATLTMLAFAIVTFSSITSSIQYQQTPLAGVQPSYTGLMFHMPSWVNMPASVADSFRDEFGRDHVVLPRVWKLRTQDSWTAQMAALSSMTVTRTLPPQTQPATAAAASAPAPKKSKINFLSAQANAVLGLSPAEKAVFPEAQMVQTGTWIREGHEDDAVVSPEIARRLNITSEDVLAGRARILVEEQKFTVVGILNVQNAETWRDLDGESLMPADFGAAGVDGKSAPDLANLPTLDPSHPMPHLHFTENPVVIVHAARALRMTDAAYKSVAVKFNLDAEGKARNTMTADQLLERLMKRIKIPVFAGIDGRSVLYESVDRPGIAGIGKLIVPILLAIFMIVNTLLGTVEERKDEIAMLNSVGLAPAHVGMLFLVEAVVYGVLGLVIGYLAGLVLAATIVARPDLVAFMGAANMSLNYSSGATILACIFVLVVVVASAIYPARAAKRMATPGTLARWVLPPSDDGTLTIEVPFTLTGGNALGMLGFLDEYLGGHHDATSPDFRVVKRYFAEEPTGENGAPELALAGDAYLAPYDLGVSEGFRICVRATGQPNIFRVRFAIVRIGGDMASFRRATQRFLDLLRRQFLIWRTLTQEEKQKYVTRATAGYKAAALPSRIPLKV